MATNIPFGMPILIESPKLEEGLNLAKELGLDFVEINSNLPLYRLDTLDIPEAKALLQRSGLRLTLHLEEYLPLNDLDERLRRIAQQILLSEIVAAKELGIRMLNLHLLNGVVYSLPDRKVQVYDFYPEAYLQTIIELRDLVDHNPAAKDMLICIENLDGYCAAVQQGIEVLLQSPRFGLTWDCGHDFCCGGADNEQWLRHTERIHHLHLHDALGTRPHLTLGTGALDIDFFLAFAAEQKASVVIEVKTEASLRRSVAYLRERGLLPAKKGVFT